MRCRSEGESAVGQEAEVLSVVKVLSADIFGREGYVCLLAYVCLYARCVSV